MMTYKRTLDFLFSQLPMYHRIGAAAYKADLSNTFALCKLLDNPQNLSPSIHVAGTNGKGSVSHMLASILQESGFNVGLYTSPHLLDFRERIRVNGKMIPKGKVIRFVEDHMQDFEKIQPSFFEMTVALAFDHFRDEKIDIGIIEVGLGGRLDSTNIITPVLSVITNVSFDHMQFLGNTLEAIAREKAGIIKKGVPVVIGETHQETKPIFIHQARLHNSQITFADDVFQSQVVHPSSQNKDLLVINIFQGQQIYIRHLTSQLAGLYQQKNIITVLEACEQLRPRGFVIDRGNIVKGIRNVIKNTGLQGRWQVLTDSPLTICDTCHNSGGLSEALAQISITRHKQLHFVFGIVNDKEIGSILRMLPKNAVYYFCKANIPRGMDAEDLKTLALKEGLSGNTYVSVKDALEAAQKASNTEDLVFVGGSTFVVAEIV